MNEWAEQAIKLLSGLDASKVTRPQMIQLAAINAQLAVAAELRTRNEIEALRLGSSALDEVTTVAKTNPHRQARANELRARIRSELGIG